MPIPHLPTPHSPHPLLAFLRALCVSAVSALSSHAIAGDLNPPVGPVAPTLKTLHQVEPRIPINSTNTPGNANTSFVISQPGSYYLTGNITGEAGKSGIGITSDNVTLDLMGFSLIGNDVVGNGITMSSFRLGLVIRNGIITGWNGNGINALIDAGRIENITAIDNGGTGILNSSGSFTTHIISCEAVQNIGSGISTGGDTIVRNCIASLNGTTGVPNTAGILAGDRAIIESCTAYSSAADAISVASNCVVRACRATAPSATTVALRVTGSRNRIEDNSLTNSGVGLLVAGTKNTVRNNLVSECTDAYQLITGNDYHLLISEIPESIDWPANVTLVGNLSRTTAGPGITIASNDVVLDLGGYALIGNGLQNFPSDGVTISGQRSNIVIRNGALRNWGDCGVDLGTGSGMTLERLDASGNLGDGLRAGSEAIITSCRAYNNTTTGITVSSLSRIENCIATSNGLHGFSVGGASSILRCDATTNGTAAGTTGAGFFVPNFWSNGRIEECSARSNEAGFDIDGAGFVIIRNIARGNPLGNFNISAGNNAGNIVATPAGAGANDNISY